MRPPTSPTTLIGGFSLAICTGTPTPASIVRDLRLLKEQSLQSFFSALIICIFLESLALMKSEEIINDSPVIC